jgi:hypothetical protein
MPKPIKPPRGIYISNAVLYHPTMSAAERETLLQLIGLAWGNTSYRTPPLSLQDMAVILDKKLRTLYGHLTALRTKHAALRLQDAGDGEYVIVFSDWVRPVPKAERLCKNLQMPVKEEESDSLNNNQDLLLPVKALEESPERNKKLQKFAKRKHLHENQRKISDDLCKQLLDAGLFPNLLYEIASSSYSETDLQALLTWCRADEPATPTALFMGRLRENAQVPKIYYQEACPVCGCFGKHADGCGYSYISGEYADFIEH